MKLLEMYKLKEVLAPQNERFTSTEECFKNCKLVNNTTKSGQFIGGDMQEVRWQTILPQLEMFC
jgi:hypothetical protein